MMGNSTYDAPCNSWRLCHRIFTVLADFIPNCPRKYGMELFFFQAKDGIRAGHVTGVQTCALPICDSAPAALVDFYIAYRALVRAKTDCVRFAQGHRGSQDSAQAHLRIATDHLRSATVRLAVIGGGPGTGKTTVSHRVAQQVGAEVISTDRVRQELHERDVITGRPGEPDAGLYAPRHVDTVYREVFARARALLAEGRSVILDGTWREPRRRAEARELAAALHAPILEIQCRTDVDTAARRVADRPAGHPSDATAQIAEHLEMDPLGWPEAVPLDTTAPQVDSAESVVRRWRALADSVSG